MIGDLLLRLHNYLLRHKIAFYIVLIALIVFFGTGVARLRVTESIFAVLPKGRSFEEFNRLIENRNIINQVVLSIDIPDETSTDDAHFLAEQFSDSLRRHTRGYLRNIQIERPDVQQDVYGYVYTHFPYLIDSAYYKHFEDKLAPDSIRNAVQATYRQLLTPGGSFLKQFVLNDPLGLTTRYFLELNADNNTSGMVIDDGLMFSADRKKLIVFASTAFDSGNSEMNVELFDLMETFRARWNKSVPYSKFSYFGTFEIAARNAIQVKYDTYFTGFLALGGILALLIIYYRKLLIPLYMLLPGAFGGLFALGIIGYVRPEISGISLATGAVIFGILLDYAFHFFTHLRHTGSASNAVREVSAPLLTGSFTTVMAFSSLHFANSTILQDFGLFSSLSLLGAAAFTLIALPVILVSASFRYKEVPAKAPTLVPKNITVTRRPWLLGVIAVLTIFFLYFARFTEFDSGVDNLSLQDQDLQKREQALTGINPKSEKRIYAFASDNNPALAEKVNFEIYCKLAELRKSGLVNSFVSSGSLLIPTDVRLERSRRWHSFWDFGRKDSTFATLDRASARAGFNNNAFDDFKNWVAGQYSSSVSLDTLFGELGINNLIDRKPAGTTFISTLIVSQKNLPQVKAALRAVPGAAIFDRGEMAGEMLTMVKDDFNYLLVISASIVFLTMLIVYGRIELTLLSFLPMVISWIWILGIAVLLGIKFNFVNVIVTTFIFGLGDDFSIFVTDGLLNKYKTGKDTLKSYQSAIILSALTTVIGTGTLIFAKHPAIHSIALISVLGIACILFISFAFQPVLFDYFVQKRIARKRGPVTMLPFLLSISSFTFFVLGCFYLQFRLLLLKLQPMSDQARRDALNRSISRFARFVIYSGPHVRKRISGLENLDLNKPAILIANHSSFLDILLAIMLSPKIVLMVKGWVYNSPFFGPIIRYAGYIYTDDGPEKNLEKARGLISQGYSILVFPEGTRSENGEIGRFHKGAFLLAEQLGVEVQPLLIHGAHQVLPKGDFVIRNGGLNVRLMPRIRYADEQWGATLREKTKSISAFFRSQYAAFADEMEDTSFLKHQIFSNYVFKGPVLEWYFKIKWKLEQDNFTFYNRLIGNRKKIVDVGCGYGYLAFFLHYKNPDRLITGIDYDEEKVEIAQKSYLKSENLQFVQADIMDVELGGQDVIFLNDILHYLSENKQLALLDRCASSLLPGGILFIRDGITDLSERHGNTKKTEALSTGLFSFNKKTDEFHFFASADIRRFAEKHSLTFEMQEHSKSTSNVLFILRKPSDRA